MILTYVLKHGRDFDSELVKAKQVAEYAIVHRPSSSKEVKHFGLKSMIANQILRKYGKNKKCKKVSRVKLIIPSQGVHVDTVKREIKIPCLSLCLSYSFPNTFSRVNQIEVGKHSIHVAVTVQEASEYVPTTFVGVDRNATGHCVVVANESSGKIIKLGKKAKHVHLKYSKTRKHLQKKSKFKRLKSAKRRESDIIRDLNHKMSKKVVSFAKESNAGIVLEDLKGIRKTRKQRKSFKYTLHSWSFYKLEQMIEYKAKLFGVPVFKIDPRYTSQQCSRCGLLGKREGKKFYCSCRTVVEDADVNAAFVIALRHKGVLQLPADRDVGKGNTDIPKRATSTEARRP